MLIETDNLLTIGSYAKKHDITPSGVDKRVKSGKIKQLIISGVKFIDEGSTDYIEAYNWNSVILQCREYAYLHYTLTRGISYDFFEEAIKYFRRHTGYNKKHFYLLCNSKIYDRQHSICIKQLPIIFHPVNSIPDNTALLTSQPFSIKKENTMLIEGEKGFF